MKMVKSLLLGSAAGIVAVVGAQAADLPVKAKPVEYVKVCSLYGAGFWYVPGTDTCIKIGSYLRVQTEYGANNGGIPIGAADGSAGGRYTRTDTSDFGFRVRGVLSLDLRTQTEYGTLRSYLQTGTQWTSVSSTAAGTNAVVGDAVYVDRAFIQFAGFTAGRVRSFFDINTFAVYSYNNTRVQGDTGALGIYALAYTAQLGNGFTATLAFEDPGLANGGRGKLVADVTTQVWAPVGTAATSAMVTDNRGVEFPDVVGALRVDQAWGYAQVSAALHDVAGGYYNTPFGATSTASQNLCGPGGVTGSGVGGVNVGPNCTTGGHPDDQLGWAITAGFTLKNVLGLQGDEFAVQAAYGHGAIGYVTRATGIWTRYSGTASVGLGYLADAVFATGTQLELTDAWGIHAAYQHQWTPQWKTSLYGGYVAIDYNANATAIICGVPASPRGATGATNPFPASGPAVAGFQIGTVSNCQPDFSWWQVGTRTQWNPHPDLDIGLDLLYTRLNTAYAGTAVLAPSGARPAGVYAIEDQDIFSAMLRIQRNFLY